MTTELKLKKLNIKTEVEKKNLKFINWIISNIKTERWIFEKQEMTPYDGKGVFKLDKLERGFSFTVHKNYILITDIEQENQFEIKNSMVFKLLAAYEEARQLENLFNRVNRISREDKFTKKPTRPSYPLSKS